MSDPEEAEQPSPRPEQKSQTLKSQDKEKHEELEKEKGENGHFEASVTKGRQSSKRAKTDAKQEEQPAWRSQREKKVVKPLLPELGWSGKRTWDAIILDGGGTPLGSIGNVSRAIDALKADDPILKKLHSLMFGCPGQKLTVKKNLKLFKGIPLNEQHVWMESMRGKLSRMNMHKEVKPICRALDIETSSDAALSTQRIVNYLMKPTPPAGSKKVSSPSSAKKSSTPKRERSLDADGNPKPKKVSGFLCFAAANRDHVKQKHPEFAFGDIGKYLGKLWSKLDAEEKASWTEKAQDKVDAGWTSAKKSLQQSKVSTPRTKKPKVSSVKEPESTDTDDQDHSDGSEREEEKHIKTEKVDKEPASAVSWPQVQVKIIEIMKAGDLDTLSIKKIKEELSSLFGAEYVAKNGVEIKEYITRRVSEEA